MPLSNDVEELHKQEASPLESAVQKPPHWSYTSSVQTLSKFVAEAGKFPLAEATDTMFWKLSVVLENSSPVFLSTNLKLWKGP